MPPGRRAAGAVALALLGGLQRHPASADSIGAGSVVQLVPPRVQALGGAGAALERDPGLLLVNPAVAARAASRSVSVGGQTGWNGGTTGTLFGVTPTQFGGFGAGVVMHDAGQVLLNASDGSSRTVRAGRDIQLLGTAAGRVGKTLTLGATARWLRSELAEELTADMVLVDAGAQIQAGKRLRLAVAFKRFGTGATFVDETAPPPGAFLGGAALALAPGEWWPETFDPQTVIILVGDAEYQVTRSLTQWRGGVEYWWAGRVALRAGGRLAGPDALGSLAVGVGLRADFGGARLRECRLDWSMRFLEAGFEIPHHVSLTVFF